MGKRRILRVVAWAGVSAIAVLAGGLYGFNNVALMDDEQFERRLDDSLARGIDWIRTHRREIASTPNVAMFLFLQDCNEIRPEPVFTRLVDDFLAGEITPDCWRRVLDRDYPVDAEALNRTIREEMLDNRWMLYSIAPDSAELSDEDLRGLFDTDRWRGRRLTHQLMALIRLREDGDTSPESDRRIETLCRRIAGHLRLNMAVVDLYIQKIAVVLDAGHGDLIDRRWIERVIENQAPDGGWNDRWCRVFTSFRRPALDLADPPSDYHATIQAVWLMYQLKYGRPVTGG